LVQAHLGSPGKLLAGVGERRNRRSYQQASENRKTSSAYHRFTPTLASISDRFAER
jgi:hypothetical protein